MTMSKNKKRPTLNEQQFSLQMQAVSDLYAQMQQELFDSMIRRLKERGSADLQENPYIWQLEKLNDMHMLNEENLQIIAERTGIAESLLRDVIENEGLKVYQDTKQQLEKDLGRSSSGTVRNGVIESLEAYTQQAVSDLNLINTTLPKSVQRVFKSVVEQTVAQVVAGTKTSDRALRDTIMGWQKKNFTGFVDKAGREWRADSYARAIIKTTTYKVYNDMRTRPAEEVGIDTFYYSIKRTARAACEPLQGKIVTKEKGRTEKGITIHSLQDYGWGTAGGCLGVHCGHYLTPFIVGVNELPELPDYLKDLTPEQAEENARIEAKQRATERAIRNQKERLHIAKQLGDDDLVTIERLKLRNLQGKIRNLVNSHDFLSRDYSRERLYETPTSKANNRAKLERKLSEYHYIKEDDIAKFKKAAGKITKPERQIVYADENPNGVGYIGTYHAFNINKALRGQGEMTPTYQKIVTTLDGVIEKNRVLENIKVNRFDDEAYFESILKYNESRLTNKDNPIEDFNSGALSFENKGFTSTSYIPKYNFFKKRPIKTIINIPKGSEVYFTDNDEESEIIIPRGAKYDIIGLKQKDNGLVVEMTLRK